MAETRVEGTQARDLEATVIPAAEAHDAIGRLSHAEGPTAAGLVAEDPTIEGPTAAGPIAEDASGVTELGPAAIEGGLALGADVVGIAVGPGRRRSDEALPAFDPHRPQAYGTGAGTAPFIEGHPTELLRVDARVDGRDSSRGRPAVAPVDEQPLVEGRRVHRLLEVVPGLVSWTLILSPILLSFRWPEIVAWFVLSFDFYWFYKAAMLTGSVVVAFSRIRKVMAADWRSRTFGLVDLGARRAELDRLMPLVRERISELEGQGARLAAFGGRRALARMREERRDLERLLARRGTEIPDPRRLWHVALIPTYTEPFEKLYETVAALARADYPRELKMVAIITRETDHPGRENVARLRDLFGGEFLHFFHILDPLEPGIVVGKSSAMAYGGRWLYREIVRLGFDPREVIVTDLDADYRVHPQYFGYLTYTFATDPDRYRRLYQPVPMFHNNLWSCPTPVRLVAVGATHVQMWRSLTPEKLVSFSSYAVSLQTVHEVDYWATDAIPEDSRFYWKSFFRYSGEFRAVPLFIPMYGDAVRARSYPRTLVQQYLQIRRWAWGITDIPYYIRNAFVHAEIPRRLRVRRLLDLWLDHINWAIAPFVMLFGSNLPLFISSQFAGGDFARSTLGQNLPLYAAWLLTGAFCCLLFLMYIEDRIAPPRPAEWGIGKRIASWVQWLLLPVVGLVFSNLPALDAQTRLMTGRYLEYRVTEKA
ncbi:MAG TPA: glycosyltransferase family 2 protein [Candidatus Limnocylindrales bacterium]